MGAVVVSVEDSDSPVRSDQRCVRRVFIRKCRGSLIHGQMLGCRPDRINILGQTQNERLNRQPYQSLNNLKQKALVLDEFISGALSDGEVINKNSVLDCQTVEISGLCCSSSSLSLCDCRLPSDDLLNQVTTSNLQGLGSKCY